MILIVDLFINNHIYFGVYMPISFARSEKIKKEDRKIAEYLCTPLGYKPNGRPYYPTLAETAFKFGFSSAKISTVKAQYIGRDTGPERHIKEEYNG